MILDLIKGNKKAQKLFTQKVRKLFNKGVYTVNHSVGKTIKFVRVKNIPIVIETIRPEWIYEDGAKEKYHLVLFGGVIDVVKLQKLFRISSPEETLKAIEEDLLLMRRADMDSNYPMLQEDVIETNKLRFIKKVFDTAEEFIEKIEKSAKLYEDLKTMKKRRKTSS